MKKFLVAICALAMMAGAVSCKDKENEDPIEEERVPEYAEGVFNPVMQLSTVAMDSVTIEEYVWEGNQLTSIRYSDGTTVNYSYENGKLSKLTANVEGENEEVRYYYTGNLLASCELDVAGVKMMDMVMKHNDVNRIDSATVTMNIEYLSSLLGDITGKGRVLVNLLGRSTTETLAKMAQVAKMDNSKLSLTNQNIVLSLGWNGENVDAQYLSASLEVSLSSADITAIGDAGLFEIPEELASLLPLIDLMGGLPFVHHAYRHRHSHLRHLLQPQLLQLWWSALHVVGQPQPVWNAVAEQRPHHTAQRFSSPVDELWRSDTRTVQLAYCRRV